MVEIRVLGEGRFEVFSEGRHCEAFEGRLGAIAAATALAGQIARKIHAPVSVATPWGLSRVAIPDDADPSFAVLRSA